MTDLIKSIPTDEKLRKVIINAIESIVDQTVIIESAKEQISSDCSVIKDDHEICPTWVKKMAKIVYDKRYNDDKKGKAIEADAELLEEVQSIIKE